VGEQLTPKTATLRTTAAFSAEVKVSYVDRKYPFGALGRADALSTRTFLFGGIVVVNRRDCRE